MKEAITGAIITAIILFVLFVIDGCTSMRYTQPDYVLSVKTMCKYGVRDYQPETGVVTCKEKFQWISKSGVKRTRLK